MDKKMLSDVNKRICDRTDCFYWQTDRKITVEEQAEIWKDRHSAISNGELLEKINSRNNSVKLSHIEPFDENAQTSQGNVNSARVGVLVNGQEVVIRCHPKGLRLANEIICFYSDNDPYVKYEVEKEFADTIATEQICIPNAGHINSESGYDTFEDIVSYL